MKRLLWPLAILIVPAILGVAGLLIARAAPPAPAAASDQAATGTPAASSSPAPASTNTASARPRPAHTPRRAPHRAGPWAVVSAYYRNVNAHNYARAWTLISSGLATGQTYQQFVAGYACTGTEHPSKLSQSGHQISFTLAVVNDCTGAAQHYTGTDTVRGGKIVAADVTRTH